MSKSIGHVPLKVEAFQIRPTVDLDKPERFAMDAHDQ